MKHLFGIIRRPAILVILLILLGLFGTHLVLGAVQPVDFDGQAYIARRSAYEVSIIRDDWGVPHVKGRRDRDAGFGLAYAQAEDHYAIIESTMHLYRARQAAVNGFESIGLDYLVQLLEIREKVNADYATDLGPEIRGVVEGFADGLNYWAALHPDQVDRALYPLTPQDVVTGFALQHLLFYGFQGPVMELFEDERTQGISLGAGDPAFAPTREDPLPIGSNAFAVSPLKSSDGATRLLMNSHQPLTGPVAWYEAHVASGEGWQFSGGLFPGSPVLPIGSNADLGWGVTVNKPDLVDIYVLTINPENENQYLLDGEWRDLDVKEASIRVKLLGNFYWTISSERLYSVHGPVIRRDHGTYAIRYAGRNEIRQVEQWYLMSKARSLDEWRSVMGMLAISSFNFVAADRSGNIGFFHNAQSPVRKEGYDWAQYLPGDLSDLIWDRYLAFDELPQVINPDSGYLLSANQSPFRVTAEGDNAVRENWSETFGFQRRMTNRATRGLELFERAGPMDADAFYAIKYDKYYSPNSRAIAWLNQLRSVSFEEKRYQEGQDLIRQWDLGTHVENLHAALGVCVISGEWLAEQSARQAPDVAQALKECVDLLLDKYGRIDVPWGQVNRLIRGTTDLPVAGGPDVLRAIYGRRLNGDGHLTAVAGDGLYLFATWQADGRFVLESIHQFGSATLDETSIHYADQAPLYVAEELKSPFFEPDDLKEHTARYYVP